MQQTRPFRIGDVTTTTRAWSGPEWATGLKVEVIEITDLDALWPIRAKVVGRPDDVGLFALGELTAMPADQPQEPSKPMTKAVLDLLKAKGTLTSIEAQGVLRCRALSKRISELKELGWNISTAFKKDTTGQRYARYHLETKAA